MTWSQSATFTGRRGWETQPRDSACGMCRCLEGDARARTGAAGAAASAGGGSGCEPSATLLVYIFCRFPSMNVYYPYTNQRRARNSLPVCWAVLRPLPPHRSVGTQGGMRTSGTLTHDLPGRQDLLAGAVAGGHRCGGDRAREPARRTQGARPRPRAACSRWQCGKPAKPSAHASHRSPVKFGRQ